VRGVRAALVQVIACSSMMPPHKIHLYRIDDLDDAENGLVALSDPTQKLVDAGITSNTNVAFERMRT
jgi:peroxiredoxin family protein